MKSTISTIATLLLATAPALAIPPEDFGFPSAPNDTALTITYNNNGSSTTVTEAELFGYGVTAQAPTIAVNTAQYQSLATYTGAYVLLMVDPDAETPQNPSKRFIWHWGQANLRATNSSSSPRMVMATGQPIVPYARPAPPPTSDAHRYILYLFQQPSNFTVPMAYSGYGAMNRTNFNLTNFISAANLGTPAAANYFFVSHKSGVPDTFVGAPSSTYPGGNGAAVTAGPGPSVSSTGSAASASSTSTSAAAVHGASVAMSSVVAGAIFTLFYTV